MHSTRISIHAFYTYPIRCTLHPSRCLHSTPSSRSVHSTCIAICALYMHQDACTLHASRSVYSTWTVTTHRNLRNLRSSGSLACRGVHVARAMGGALAPSYAYGTHDQQSTMTLTPRLLDSVLPGERRASSRRSSYAHSLCCAPCLSTL